MEFASINVEGMNETDVREAIVRPFIHALGYAYGTTNNIRTEITLRYEKAFLGRKNPTKDPPLRGRADYICEVVPYGRWVVEVKAPHEDLTLDVAQQAHTYAAHPDVAAIFYLVTNGREFRLYRTSYPDAPALSWSLAETSEKLPAIRNAIGPTAIKKLARANHVDADRPLAEGLRSKVRIVGGYLTYSEHTSNRPVLNANIGYMTGMQASIIGRSIYRTEEGLLRGELEIARATELLDQLNRAAGFGTFIFESSDAYISTEQTKPSIFQNMSHGSVPAGTVLAGLPNTPPVQVPFGMEMDAFTEAVGFFDGERMHGTFSIEYRYRVMGLDDLPSDVHLFADLMHSLQVLGAGTFVMNVI